MTVCGVHSSAVRTDFSGSRARPPGEPTAAPGDVAHTATLGGPYFTAPAGAFALAGLSSVNGCEVKDTRLVPLEACSPIEPLIVV